MLAHFDETLVAGRWFGPTWQQGGSERQGSGPVLVMRRTHESGGCPRHGHPVGFQKLYVTFPDIPFCSLINVCKPGKSLPLDLKPPQHYLVGRHSIVFIGTNAGQALLQTLLSCPSTMTWTRVADKLCRSRGAKSKG